MLSYNNTVCTPGEHRIVCGQADKVCFLSFNRPPRGYAGAGDFSGILGNTHGCVFGAEGYGRRLFTDLDLP